MPVTRTCHLQPHSGPTCGREMTATSSVWIEDGTEVITYHCPTCDRNPSATRG